MAKTVNVQEAKTHLSRLVEQAATGQEIIIIAKAGKPMARLVPLESQPYPKKFGLLKGQINVPDDFNTPLQEDVLVAFEGR